MQRLNNEAIEMIVEECAMIARKSESVEAGHPDYATITVNHVQLTSKNVNLDAIRGRLRRIKFGDGTGNPTGDGTQLGLYDYQKYEINFYLYNRYFVDVSSLIAKHGIAAHDMVWCKYGDRVVKALVLLADKDDGILNVHYEGYTFLNVPHVSVGEGAIMWEEKAEDELPNVSDAIARCKSGNWKYLADDVLDSMFKSLRMQLETLVEEHGGASGPPKFKDDEPQGGTITGRMHYTWDDDLKDYVYKSDAQLAEESAKFKEAERAPIVVGGRNEGTSALAKLAAEGKGKAQFMQMVNSDADMREANPDDWETDVEDTKRAPVKSDFFMGKHDLHDSFSWLDDGCLPSAPALLGQQVIILDSVTGVTFPADVKALRRDGLNIDAAYFWEINCASHLKAEKFKSDDNSRYYWVHIDEYRTARDKAVTNRCVLKEEFIRYLWTESRACLHFVDIDAFGKYVQEECDRIRGNRPDAVQFYVIIGGQNMVITLDNLRLKGTEVSGYCPGEGDSNE